MHRAGNSPFHSRNFRLLWAGRTTSEFGSALAPVALTFAVLDMTGSASALGWVLTSSFVSRTVLLLVGGAIADRLSRHEVMLATDALRACTQAAVAALLLTGAARLWGVVSSSRSYGAGDAFFSPASARLVPEIVEPSDLRQANALLGASRSSASNYRRALGGLLVTVAPAGTAFAIDAGSFVVSTAALALLQIEPGPRRVPGDGVLADLALGWREVKKRSWVWMSIGFFALSNLAIAPLYVLGPLAARAVPGRAAPGPDHGLRGSRIVGRRRGRLPSTASTSTHSGLPRARHLGGRRRFFAKRVSTSIVCASAVLGFGALSFSNTLWLTALQEQIPVSQLGQISSYDWLGSRLLQPAEAALGRSRRGTVRGVGDAARRRWTVRATTSVAVALCPSVRRLRRAEAPGN